MDDSGGCTDIATTEVNSKAKATDSLVPITPDTVRESVVSKQLKLACIDSESERNDNGSPRTPKDGVFDPFAPGPDNLARAPQSKKYLDDLSITVARRLNFDPSFHDVESLSDQDMFQSVYQNLLQLILSKHTEGILAQMSNVEYDSDNCKTPPSPLRFSGISDTCPGAPLKVKPGSKPRNIQLGLCKKLEF